MQGGGGYWMLTGFVSRVEVVRLRLSRTSVVFEDEDHTAFPDDGCPATVWFLLCGALQCIYYTDVRSPLIVSSSILRHAQAIRISAAASCNSSREPTICTAYIDIFRLLHVATIFI